MKPDFLQICILATESHESPPFTTITLSLFSPPLPVQDEQEAGLQLSLKYMCNLSHPQARERPSVKGPLSLRHD